VVDLGSDDYLRVRLYWPSPFSAGYGAANVGHHEPAATISGFALSPLTAVSMPEINIAIAHLRDVLGDQTYESLARKGETMSTAAMVTYAYEPNRPGPSRAGRRLEIDGI